MALDKLPEGEGRLDLPALLEVCRRHGLRTLAIRAGRGEDIAAAQALDLPVLPPSGARERPLDIKDSAPRKPAEEPSPSAGEARPEPAKAEEKPAEPVSRPTKVVKTPVRGGMQIYAAAADRAGRGQSRRGTSRRRKHPCVRPDARTRTGRCESDATARIFCQQLAAELVSIAGNYKVAEDLRRSPQWGKAVHVSLSGDVLNITRL